MSNTGLGVYKITQANATATLSGSNSKVYDGQAITVAQVNGGTIKVNLGFPGGNDATYTLQSGDYTISGNATDAGDYKITLTDQGITNIEHIIESLAGNGQQNQSNVTFADNAITGTATFTIDKSQNVVSVGGTQTAIYNGSPINVVYNADGTNSVTVSITRADGNTTGATGDLTKVTLGSGDFTVVDGPAENAGSYQVALTNTGLQKIQQALGDNFAVSVAANTTGTLQVDKYKGSAAFDGNPVYAYTGEPVSTADYLEQYSIKLKGPNNPTYQFVPGDLEFLVNGNWTAVAPVNAGTYRVRVSQQGWNNIKKVNSENVEWSATSSSGTGTYTIKAAEVTAELSGKNSLVYTGNAVTTADLYAGDSTIQVAINGTNISNLPASFKLDDGDYEWVSGSTPMSVGNYQLKLTQSGLDKIQSFINDVVGQGNVILVTTPGDGGTADFEITQAVANNVQLYGNEQSTYSGKAVDFDPTNISSQKNYGFHNTEGLNIPQLTSADFEWVDKDGNPITTPVNKGTYYLQLNEQEKQAIANANPNYRFVANNKSTISGMITYTVVPADLAVTVSGTASKIYNGQDAKVTQQQINAGDIKVIWTSSDHAPLLNYDFTPTDFEIVDKDGQPALHANAGIDADGKLLVERDNPYYVRLTAAAMEKIKSLAGADNYDISQTNDSGEYLIYAQKAELTLTGSQTTTYGTPLALDPSAYHLDFSNWTSSNAKPNIQLQAGDIYVDANDDDQEGDQLPTDVGEYKVKIAEQLADRLQKLYPDYDFAGTINAEDNAAIDYNEITVPKHNSASYNIVPALATITIDGAQHVKYGESAAIQDGQYTATVTAPVSGSDTTVVSKVALDSADLTTVPSNANVGHYELKLTDAGLAKIQQAIIGHGDVTKNYDWTQANTATTQFYVDQMTVSISVSGTPTVTYGSDEWLTAIKSVPSGYTINVVSSNGADLGYTLVDGDVQYVTTPGNVGEYQVVLTVQGLQNIEKAFGTNYEYPQTADDTTSTAKLTVNKADANVEMNGSWEHTYDTKETLPSMISNQYRLGGFNVYKADGTSEVVELQPSDIAFENGVNATNVGTYNVVLSESGKERIKALDGNSGNNYNWTFGSTALYTIDQATGQAKLTGQNAKVYDGQPVTTVQLNSNGQIVVNLTLPVYQQAAEPGEDPILKETINLGSYTLQDGDYIWNTADGKAPINVDDSYSITLNQDKILSHLQARLTELSGTGQNGQSNVTITADKLSGQATFKITPTPITNVTISGDDQTKTHNGNRATLDISGLKISGDGVINAMPLTVRGITADDFDWYDASGNKLDAAPINVDSYTARLKDSALTKLQQANQAIPLIMPVV